MNKPVSMVIPNWNRVDFLRVSIPSIMKAVYNYGNNTEVIVVDNGSRDASIGYLKENFPQIKVIPLEENLGFATAMNIGIKETRGDIVIGLNNDVIVEGDFISPLISHFYNNGDIFAVAAKMLLWDKKTLNFGKAKGNFYFGVFRRALIDSPCATNTLYACGGGFAVNKNKFLELDGFDEDMMAYWEDTDLCYRAWKRGWKTIYEPKSIIYHKFHGTSIKRYGESGIRKISGENYFLFVLKNIHDKAFFYQQIIFLPLLMLRSVFVGKSYFALGLLSSLKRWPLFLKKRRIEKNKAILSDRQVFRISGQNG